MQRLAVAADSEGGGISVIVAILMVVLLGFAALAIDVGVLYSERAQLQNGSDAAALSVAQRCAANEADPGCSATSTLATELASDLANKNALDSMSNIKSITLDTDGNTVSVAVSAKETGSASNSVSLFFANVLGFSSAEVSAKTTVQWGTPSKGDIMLPLAIAECKFNINPAAGVGSEQVLELAVNGCGGIPGGFGWLNDSSDGKCSITVTAGPADHAGTWVYSDTGASMPSVCTAADLSKMNNQTVLLPLYAVAAGTGSGGAYYIKGFAAFHVTAYHFASASWQISGGQICNKCIRGRFVKFVSFSQALELGSAPDYGASVVRLTIGES